MQKHHFPRKRFGQHFLHDVRVIQYIMAVIAPKKTEKIIEIGPGLGALTQYLLPLIGSLDVIELDRDIIPLLQKKCAALGELHIHQADALRFDFSQLTRQPHSLRLVGNLPYNISTPLLFHLFNYIALIQDMYFMLQKEVVERMAAQPNEEAYGRLSVMVQYYCRVEMLFVVKPNAFTPPPKVDSAIVKLIPHTTIAYPAQDIKLFEEVVRLAFNQRRKTLKNSLQTLITADQLLSLNLDPTLRAENMHVESFVQIANFIASSS
jgi:16S rRNA (adenine1518-N6/adenine1519-N6)-dimethyltransferase